MEHDLTAPDSRHAAIRDHLIVSLDEQFPLDSHKVFQKPLNCGSDLFDQREQVKPLLTLWSSDSGRQLSNVGDEHGRLPRKHLTGPQGGRVYERVAMLPEFIGGDSKSCEVYVAPTPFFEWKRRVRTIAEPDEAHRIDEAHEKFIRRSVKLGVETQLNRDEEIVVNESWHVEAFVADVRIKVVNRHLFHKPDLARAHRGCQKLCASRGDRRGEHRARLTPNRNFQS